MKGKRTFETPNGLIREREFQEREGWEADVPELMQRFHIEPEHEAALISEIHEALVGFDVEGIARDLSIGDAKGRKKRSEALLAGTVRIEAEVAEACRLAFSDEDPEKKVIAANLAVIVEKLSKAAAAIAAPTPLRDNRNDPLKAAAKVLVRFWKEHLGRAFHSDHNAWTNTVRNNNGDTYRGPKKGTDKGDRFVWDALSLTGIPAAMLDGLRTVLRSGEEARSRSDAKQPRLPK